MGGQKHNMTHPERGNNAVLFFQLSGRARLALSYQDFPCLMVRFRSIAYYSYTN